MSGPTKGMVAGQPIQTGAQTKEYDDNFDRIFGEPKSRKGGRWRWDAEKQQMVEIGSDWTDTERRAQYATEELVYGNLPPEDGQAINSKTKHREFMKRNGLALRSDYDGCREKLNKQREDRFLSRDTETTRERRELLGRALHESKRKRK